MFLTLLFFAFSDTCTALVFAIQWYSNHLCITGVQHLCVRYSGTALVCAVQWYSTCVFSTVIQHLCVQYSKRVGLKGPAQCIVPAGAHCLV